MKIFQKLVYVVALLATTTIGIAMVAGIRSAYALATSVLQTSKAAQPVIAVPEPPVTATEPTAPIVVGLEQTESGEGNEGVDFSGEYYLQSEGVPKPFADFNYLELVTHEYDEVNDGYVARAIAPKGSVRTKTPLKFSRIAIGGREISLQTETVDGVSYKFTGKFPDYQSENYCDIDAPQPDLKGKLIKIKDGKWAAEMDANFYVACTC